MFVCLNDDADNLRIALQVRQVVSPLVDIFVPASAWIRGQSGSLLGPHSGIVAVPYSSEHDSLDILRDNTREAMARVVHEQYLRTLAANESTAASDQPRPAQVPWEELSDDLREANRRHVDHIVASLRTIWFAPAPLYDWDEPARALPEEQIDVLAEREHQRWCDELRGGGWRFGAVRNDERREHPLLVPWARLPEVDREIDRELVRAWPAVLHLAGCRLEQSPQREVLARLLHQTMGGTRRLGRSCRTRPASSTERASMTSR